MSEKDDTSTENLDGSYVEECSESRNSERSTEESIEETDAKKGASQENTPEVARVAVTISSLNPTVPPYTPRYSTAWSQSDNLHQNNVASFPPQLQILFPPLPPGSGTNPRQMDLFNSTMGRFRSMQNHNAPQTLVAGLPQGFGTPYPLQPVAHLLIPQQPNYDYQPQQTIFYQPELLPPPNTSTSPRLYHNPYTNLRHLDGYSSCPYGHNVISPYPALCAYCFPETQPNQNEYSFEEERTESYGGHNRKRKGSGGDGKRGGGNGRSSLGRSRRENLQISEVVTHSIQNATSRKPEDEARTSIEENTESSFELPIVVPSEEQIPLEDHTHSTSTIVPVDSPEEMMLSDVSEENETVDEELEQLVPEIELPITNTIIVPDPTTTETALSKSTSPEDVLEMTPQVTCVQGSNVSCQTESDRSDTKLMIECWTQTDSSSSTIKYASRYVSFDTQDTGTSIETETTVPSSPKEKRPCSEVTTNTSSSKISILKVKSEPLSSKISKANIKSVASTSKISTGNVKPVASTSKISTTNVKPIHSTSKILTISSKPVASTSKISTASVKPVTSTSKVSTAKPKPTTYADIVAKKASHKKAIPKTEETKPKTPVNQTKTPVSVQSLEKDNPLSKPKDSVPQEDKGPESRKLRMPIIFELTLDRRMELSALRSSFQKYISKGMKLYEVTNKVYLLIFYNNGDAKEVRRTNYTFGEIKSISEASPMSQKEAELILANVL